MRNSLLWKLTISFMLVAVAATALVAVFIRVTSVDRLTRLIYDQQRSSLLASLQDYYTQQGSWSGVSASWQEIRLHSVPTQFPVTSDHFPPPSRERPRLFGLADAQGKVLVSIDFYLP